MLSLIACSAAESDPCLPPGVTYDAASAAYGARRYAQASREFEAVALGSEQCKSVQSLEGSDRELIVYETLAAADAAHWAGDGVRSRVLALRARALSRRFASLSKHDHRTLFALSLDDDHASRDLAGTWTLGLRH